MAVFALGMQGGNQGQQLRLRPRALGLRASRLTGRLGSDPARSACKSPEAELSQVEMGEAGQCLA